MEAEKALQKIDGLPFLFIRPTGIYGPRDPNFGQLLDYISKGFDIRLASEKQKLCFVQVTDLAKLSIDLIESSEINRSFNVTDGNVYSPGTFSQILKDAVGKKALTIRIPRPILFAISYTLWGIALLRKKNFHLSPYKMKELTAASWECDISAIRKATNYQPKYDLKKGIEEYQEWYSSIPD